jgi:hypothetical protein
VNLVFSPQIIPVISSRDLFPKTLNQSSLLGEGVEIGVLQASFSEWILEHWKGKCLHSIDPWLYFSDGSYVDGHNLSDSNHEEHYRIACEKLSPFGNRSKIHRKRSEEAAPDFLDGSLDFVYIDAQHHYEAVCDDIARWYPKVKVGGIIGGHDFFKDGDYPFGRFGVQRAVIDLRQNSVAIYSFLKRLFPLPLKPPLGSLSKRQTKGKQRNTFFTTDRGTETQKLKTKSSRII